MLIERSSSLSAAESKISINGTYIIVTPSKVISLSNSSQRIDFFINQLTFNFPQLYFIRGSKMSTSSFQRVFFGVDNSMTIISNTYIKLAYKGSLIYRTKDKIQLMKVSDISEFDLKILNTNLSLQP